MYIARVQVEEGFLDGLDLNLVEGLNVVIGARGTGKTSVIELVRFALGVPGYTNESSKRSIEHARSILGSGRVTVTLRKDSRAVVATRSASESEPTASGKFVPPLIFSQTEIESVGLSASGRLRLLDSFIHENRDIESNETALVGEIQSLTVELQSIGGEIQHLEEELKQLPVLEGQAKELAAREEGVAQSSLEAKKKKENADALAAEAGGVAATQAFLERSAHTLQDWIAPLSKLVRADVGLEAWSDRFRPDPLSQLRARFERAVKSAEAALNEFASIREAVAGMGKDLATKRLTLEDQARQLRREIESLQAGAGAIVREAGVIRAQRVQLEALKTVLHQHRKRAVSIRSKRNQGLDQLEGLREQRFDRRRGVAETLSKSLSPYIRVSVERAGLFDDYTQMIAEALRGSGVRYTDLATQLARSTSPRELLEAAESTDFESLAETVGISKDRAARVLAHLREHGLPGIATCLVEDDVRLQLLDGHDFKDVAELSTGQRCTVVLPLVLQHRGRVVLVDQPEDHIDNAFIADTLIKAILRRGKGSQTLFSTHNANIPVLGDADQVTQLGSDGRRGFVVMSSPLDAQDAVEAITTVMEGGREAFNVRAKFYAQHGDNGSRRRS